MDLRALTDQTPAFVGCPELTFEGNDFDDAYGKLLKVNPAWNCTVVGGCPKGKDIVKRADEGPAQVVGPDIISIGAWI